MIATDMNSHKRILSRRLALSWQPSRKRETRSVDFSTKRVLITLGGGVIYCYAPVVGDGAGRVGVVAPPIPPPLGPP